MNWFSIIIGILGILLTVKPFIRNANWFVRLGDFPRLQVLILLLVSLVLEAIAYESAGAFEYVFGISLIACIIYQIYAILPFTIFYRKEVQLAKNADHDDKNLSLLIFNILMENQNYDEVLRLIEDLDADIVLLAEPDDVWAQKLAPLEKKYPNKVAHPLDNHYGMMLFSRLPLSDTEIKFLIDAETPSIHTKIKLRSGDEIALHGVHPRPPVPQEKGRSTERDGELLLVGRSVCKSDLPGIVAGDLNDAAWSYTTKLFKKVSGLLDPRVGRGFYNTFHADYPIFRLPLDHVFHSQHFRLIRLDRIKNSCGSDHFPIFVELSLEQDAPAEQSKPAADGGEKEEAKEAIGAALKENGDEALSTGQLSKKITGLEKKISRKS